MGLPHACCTTFIILVARSVLRLIGEERSITAHDEEAPTSHEPSIITPTSSIVVRMQSIRGRGRGRGGGRGHGRARE